MILVDTSVWIGHLHRADEHVARLLETAEVLTHPMVIGEIALGTIKNRAQLLQALDDLPTAVSAADDEFLAFIEQRAPFGRGLNLVDTHPLASALLTPETRLWTRDRRLRGVAEGISVAYLH